MKKYLLFGVIASVLSINAYAVSATVTSKDYVDTTRQATIPASGTNASTPGDTVVTYTDTAGTIGERGIFDDWNVGIEENSLQDNLVTAGALLQATDEIYDYFDDEISNIPAPELPTGTPGYAVLYDENGDIGDGMIILDENFNLLSGESSYDLDGDGYGLLTQRVLGSSTDFTSDLTAPGKIYPTVSGVRGYAQPSIPAGTQGSVVIYNGTVDSGPLHGKTKFTEKAIANAPIITNGTLTNGNDIASINAVQTKQNKMTCTRWIDNAAHTDANCLLWNIN